MQADQHYPSTMGSAEEMAAKAFSACLRTVPIKKAPCECSACEKSFFTTAEQRFDRYEYASVLNDAQASSILSEYLNDITNSRKYLAQSIDRYDDHVLTRWRKLTQQKRAALLQIAEPTLPLRKGLGAETMCYLWPELRRHKRYHLLPYLDVDTLIRSPVVLLSLIRTRTTHSPQEWVSFDNEQLGTGWSGGLFDVYFNAGAVIMHGDKYGTWTSFEKTAAHSADMLGFPRGSLVLEAQATLLKFLKRVVKHLVEGYAKEELSSNAKWQQFLATGLKAPDEAAAWSTFVNRPFTAPPRFEVDKLLTSAKIRREATGDHLWLLQTEPSYFKRHIRKISQTQIIEAKNNKEASAEIIYAQIAHEIEVYWLWSNVVREFKNLQAVHQRYRDSFAPGMPLPLKVDQVLGAVDLMLVYTIEQRSKHLQAVISQRPGFRHLYEHHSLRRSSDGEQWDAVLDVKRDFTDEGENGKLLAFRTERLWFVILQMLGPPDDEKRFQYGMLLGMLDDHLAASTPAERGRLDDVLYEIVSEFVTLLELLWTIRSHRPLYARRTAEECAMTEDGHFWEPTKIRYHNDKPVGSAKASAALRKFQNTAPPSGPRNRQWLNQLDALHGTSQDLWKETAAIFRKLYRGSYPSVDFEKDMSILFAWKDKQYIARLDAKREQILSDSQKPKIPKSEDVFLPLSTSELDEKFKPAVVEVKSKVKTRGQAQPAQEDASDTPKIEDVTTKLSSIHLSTTIPVSKRSYATFRYMFPLETEERQKSIDWSAFMDSMTDAGFVAKNGGGSIVIFENIAGGGRILFHRPHPEPVIDLIMLQSMGNRLNKWFRWERDTFKLAKK